MQYYSDIKRNKNGSFIVMWMKLESVIQSEVSQKEKNKFHILMHIYIYIYIYMESRKMVLKNLFTWQQWRNRYRK